MVGSGGGKAHPTKAMFMASIMVSGELPEQWRAAYEHDRLSAGDYADPGPERRAARALAAFIAAGLAFLALPGTLLGVWNLIEIASHRAANAASVAWIQAHGQAQLLGWVGSFILGISLYALPKFRHRPLRNFGLVWTVWVLWTMGVAWRWWVGVSVRGWRVGLVASALMELAAYALTQRILLFSPERIGEGKNSRRKPHDLGSWLGIVGFGALGLALTFNLGISIMVALKAATPVYPPRLDRAFLIVALWGFTVPVAWGYSTRFVTIFLGLHPPDHGAACRLGLGIVAIIVCALARWFLLADALILMVTILAIHALRVLRPSVRPPKLAGVYRLYPQFIRLSYAWLLVGAVLGLAADIWGKEAGLGGASRHAVTVGFVATLIFALAPRLLPAFLGGRELYRVKLMAASLWALSMGCLLRVSSEAIAYSAGGWAWHILPVSAMLELAAVLVFVFNMAITLGQARPAWLEPSGVTARLPVYWYVTSFPETRKILVDAGLKALSQVREPPRSLTLEEAAAAEGVDLQEVLRRLQGFFSRRQPRSRANGSDMRATT